jgi:hypothetical protein
MTWFIEVDGARLWIDFTSPTTFQNSPGEFALRHAKAHAYWVSTISP